MIIQDDIIDYAIHSLKKWGKKMFQNKRKISLLLVCCLIVSVFPFSVVAGATELANGTCGESLVWSLDSNNILTISGNGAMTNYTANGENSFASWYDYRNSITDVVVQPGVTSIGDYAFNWYYSGIEKVTIPDTVTYIGDQAFCKCIGLDSVIIPDSVTEIDWYAFYGCSNLETVKLSTNMSKISGYLFAHCTNLKEIHIPESIITIDNTAFENCISLITVHGSAGSYAEEWAMKKGYQFVADDSVDIPVDEESPSEPTIVAEPGSKDNPYKVYSAESLAAIRYDLDACYIQVSDIDLSDYANWEPIGNSDEAFSGVFDGGGHLISGLNISIDQDSADKEYVGLFGKSTGTIANVNLVESNISTSSICIYVGSICGYAQEITNCFSSCNIDALCHSGGGIAGSASSISASIYTGTADFSEYTGNMYWGGICGYAQLINKSYNAGRINGYAYASGLPCLGGIAGYARNVEECCNAGEIKGIAYGEFDDINIGGIVGLSGGGTISDSYNSGNLTGDGYVVIIGGIAGRGYDDCSYLRCYNKGNLNERVHYSYVGGVVGFLDSAQSAEYCYWNNGYEISSSTSIRYAEGTVGSLSESQFTNQDSFVGFDFVGIWEFGGGTSYPYPTLKSVRYGQVIDHLWSSGKVTKEQTCTNYGEITYTCILCGETRIEYLLPLGHDYTSGICNRCGADSSSSVEFNEYLYRANRLLDDSTDEAGYVAGLIAMDTPTELMVDLLQRNGFDDGAAAWTAFTGILDSLDDVTEIGELHFEQQDVYSAIILSSLEASAEIAVADTCENISKDAAALCQYLHDTLKAADGIVIVNSEDYKKLSEEGKERIKALLEAFFKDKHPNLPMLDDILSDFDKFLGAADCLETFTEQFYTYYELIHLTESMKDVLREMYALSQSSTNEYLQYAMKDCVKIMETSAENMYSACFVNEGLRISGRYALKEVVGALWDEVKSVAISYYPAIGVLMVAYHGGKFISNWLCSSDSLVEQYYNMIATLKIENLAETAEASLRKKYAQQADVRSASAFVDSVDILYGIFYEDCDASYDFCDVVDNATLNQIKQLFGASDYSEVKANILELKDVVKDQQVLYQVMWIDALQDDWPELYEVYRHRLAEAIKPLKEKYREYLVACPVNVYVYDAVDNLVAYVIDGYPYSTGNVTVTVMGDDKRIHFYDDGEYRIVCEGYDNGTMDVSIIEYSDGGISREANFYDLEVTTGASYEMDTKADPTDSVAYTVFSDGNAEVTADYDSNLATNADKVQLSIKNGFLNTKEGPVFQISATAGERVNISACVPDDYRFIRWEVKEGLNCVDDLWDSVTIVRVGEQDIVINAILELNNPFNDVPEDSFYYTPVLWAVDEGITNGATETTFNPNGQCQRAQVVTFLWRAAGCPEPETAVNPFTDVKESDFYYKAVLWAVENGITNGLDTTHFGPFAYCNRAQVVTFLYRAMEQTEVGVTECPFTDVQDGAWYEIPVLWAVENGVTNGMDAVTFGVNTICNRAQVVTFLYRAFEK